MSEKQPGQRSRWPRLFGRRETSPTTRKIPKRSLEQLQAGELVDLDPTNYHSVIEDPERDVVVEFYEDDVQTPARHAALTFL